MGCESATITNRGCASTLREHNYTSCERKRKTQTTPCADKCVEKKKETPCADPCASPCKSQMSGYCMNGSVGALIVWFFLIFIVTWLLLYALKPQFVINKETGEIDYGKVLLAAAVVALIIIIIIWLIKVAIMGGYSC